MLKLFSTFASGIVFFKRQRKAELCVSKRTRLKGMAFYFASKSILLFTCLLLCLPSPSCVERRDCASSVGGNCQFSGPELTNTRIEVNNQSSLHPSNTIWLLQGEQLIALWDSYTLKLNLDGATCNFDTLTLGTDQCKICNLCDDDLTSFRQLCPGPVFIWPADQGAPRVVAFDDFNTNAQRTTIESPDAYSGCSAYGNSPVAFTPTGNSTFQVLSPEASTSQAVLTEKKVFVIQNGMSQTATYKMEQHTDVSSSLVFYRWTVGNNPVWEDNFSTNLSVGKVRVLKGRAVSDPLSGRLMLEDATIIHPSRIVLIPDFDPTLSVFTQDTNRCYANSSEDGDFDLTRCRPAFGNNSGFLVDATPTYLKTQPMDQFSWIVEFNPAEGGVSPVLATGEVLAIEFTIQGV